MTREEAIKMAKSFLKCMEREASGQDEMCNSHKCDECSLNYEQGNTGEQKEWLRMVIKALEQEPCDDCVSRQAVVEFLRDHSKDFEDERIKVAFMAASSLVENTEYIPPVTLTQRWIPVSERLPESSGVYIVSRWFSDGEESAVLADANYYDGNGDWYNDNRINWGRDLVTDRIVAWMPLPEPYLVESEE